LAGALLSKACIGALLSALAGTAAGQIYTCVDAKGRRITSDRPIAECMDRSQHELNSSGTVRRTIKPQLTAEERAAEEGKNRREAEARLRAEEDRQRSRALLARYPDADSHQRERQASLRTVDDMISAGRKREADLEAERQKLGASSTTADPATRQRNARQLEEIQRQLGVQRRQIAEGNDEKKRINAQFDGELARLKPLWSPAPAAQPVARKP
jgi:hypothetical protein